MKESLIFIKQFIKKPISTGAISPSSKHLAKEIVRQAGVADADLILEFGPGTGSFTAEIIKSKKDNADFIAVEKNPALVNILKQKFPDTRIFCDSIENIDSILKSQNIERKADCIVCGLPWAAFDQQLQTRLLNATRNILKPGGVFTTFAYLQGLLLPAGQRFKKAIQSTFSKVEKSKVIWKNFPPAFIYKCTVGQGKSKRAKGKNRSQKSEFRSQNN